jgi:hypothetical protein
MWTGQAREEEMEMRVRVSGSTGATGFVPPKMKDNRSIDLDG